MFDVAVIGSANLDLVVRTERHPLPGETLLGSDYAEYPGGKGLNQAVAAARSGASTTFIGAVGDDDAGTTLRDVATAEHLDLSQLLTASGIATGRAVITVDDAGENSIIVVPGANHHVAVDRALDCTVALVQLEIPLDVVMRSLERARACGATTMLNPAPAATLPPELLALCDIVIPNEHEVDRLGGVEAILRHDVRHVIVTLGANGVDLTSADGTTFHVEALPAEVVDTTGAGDAFCGNLAARLAAGDALEHAIRWAVAAASIAVSRPGAIPSLPHAHEVAALIERQ